MVTILLEDISALQYASLGQRSTETMSGIDRLQHEMMISVIKDFLALNYIGKIVNSRAWMDMIFESDAVKKTGPNRFMLELAAVCDKWALEHSEALDSFTLE